MKNIYRVHVTTKTYDRMWNLIDRVWGMSYKKVPEGIKLPMPYLRFYNGRSFDDVLNEILDFATISIAKQGNKKNKR